MLGGPIRMFNRSRFFVNGILFWLSFKNDFFIEIVISIHEFIVNLLYWIIGIHILATTYHRLKKDGVWSSMVPFFKEYK